MHASDLDNTVALIYRAFENSNLEIRLTISKLFAKLLYKALTASTETGTNVSVPANSIKKQKFHKISSLNKKRTTQIFAYLSNGFTKYSSKFFTKASNNAAATNNNSQWESQSSVSLAMNREIRAGVTYTYIELIALLDSDWLERNLNVFIHIILQLLNNQAKSDASTVVFSRQCVYAIFNSTINTMLNENQQVNAAKEFIYVIDKAMTNIGELSHAKPVKAILNRFFKIFVSRWEFQLSEVELCKVLAKFTKKKISRILTRFLF
jgi:hypothetical protein